MNMLTIFIVTALAAVGGGTEEAVYSGPGNAELDAAQDWLWSHPETVDNQAERYGKWGVIQAAADQTPSDAFTKYMMQWFGTSGRAELHEQAGVCHCMARAAEHVIEEVRNTNVSQGLVLWHVYNMGYIFKTPEACFGIDICSRDGARMAELLDFLLVTHAHLDHTAGGCIAAMIKAGKPVITNFQAGSQIVKEVTEIYFGTIRVRIELGDHAPNNPSGADNMLQFQVDCGESGGNRVIYHTGDGANCAKMTPDKPVDVLIAHIECAGTWVGDIIRKIAPNYTFVSHLLEMTHNGKYRYSYEAGQDAVKEFPAENIVVPAWGERWVAPGTVVAPS